MPFVFAAGVLLFLLALAVHYALLAFEAAREAERRQLELELLTRDAELRALRAQIDPHFLYNSLNSISALTASDPAGARRMCVLLGGFLRDTLSLSSRERIPLAEELALADSFLSIEQVRFGARLQVDRRIDDASAACLVPPLLLQPLVENAITHGIAGLLEGGVIRLDIARRNGTARSVSKTRASRTPAPPEPAAWVSTTCAAVWRPRSAVTRAWKYTPARSSSASSSICHAPPMSDVSPVPLKVAIVDDEELARAVVREYLAAMPGVDVVAECANGFEAVKAVSDLHPDLLLLDVQMPKLNGFEVMELVGRDVAVVFVTAYDQYALRAFDVHAVDYLLKPFSAERLAAALERARERLGRHEPMPIRELAAAARPSPSYTGRILVRDGPRVHVLPVEKIDYVQAQDDYVCFRCEGKEYLKEQTLAQVEASLDPAKFVRIHRSYVLNLDRLARVELDARENRIAILADGRRLPVSRAGYGRLTGIN